MALPGTSAHLLSRWPLRSIWPWVGLLVGVALSILVWLKFRSDEQARIGDLQRVQAKAMVDQLKGRMLGLEEVLLGAAEYLGRGSLPSRAEWNEYVGAHHLSNTYPGVQGFGFVEWIPNAELVTHIRRIQEEGFPDYQVIPGGTLPPDPEGYSSIIYLEPMDPRNQRAFGRDLLREANRRQAMIRARDTGFVTLSGPVTLYQETSTEIQSGALLMAPVYRQGLPHDTVAQRRKALRGWTSYPFRMADFIHVVLARDLAMMDFQLSDADGFGHPFLLFNSGPSAPRLEETAVLAQSLELAGRTWMIRVRPNAGFYAAAGHHNHWEYLAGGLVFSLLLFTLLVTVQGAEGRARSLAQQRGEELLASESQFRMISENVGDVVWVLGLEPIHCEFVSPSVMQARGLSPEEVMAEPWENALTPDSLAKVQRLLSERIPAFHTDDPGTWAYTDEVDQVRKDGTVFPTEVTTRLLSDSQGKVVRVIGISRDITDRRKAEEALQLSESRLRILGDQLLDSFIYQYTFGQGQPPRFLYLSAGVERLCGFKPEILLRDASPFLDQLDPTLHQAYREKEAASARDLAPFAMDLRLRRADGVWRWFRVRSMPRRQADESLIWDGIATDVTEQMENELALAESEIRFRNMVKLAGDAIYLNDVEGRVFLCNRAACRSTGYAMEELLQLRIGELDSEFLDPENVVARRSLQAGQVISIQSRHRRKDGSTFPVEVRIALFREEEPRQILAVVRDLSEREQMQESELRARKAESLVLMAGAIAHDFNNLFQSIQGNLEIVSMLSEGQPTLAQPLNRAMGILDKAISLSWKMLDFSGHGFVHPDRLQLEDWLPAYLAILRLEFPSTFRMDLICDSVLAIKGDPSKLEQVVKAVLDNVLEAAAAGMGQAHLRLFVDKGEDRPGPESQGCWPLKRPAGPVTVCLEIADDGPGVLPEQLSLICDPFYTSKEPGRGLGLSVVVGILRAHRAGLHILNGKEKGLILRMHFLPAEAVTPS